MRILVVGAGAIGGYFGGRLIETGRDVTFLVRPRRAAELAANGLVVESTAGDFTRPAPPTVLASDLGAPFDLILLSCKAYSLDDAIASFAPAVGPSTAILPLLNGMRHLEILDGRVGAARVLGGQCVIAATLGSGGRIIHLNQNHELSFGERDGAQSDRVRAIADVMAGAKFEARASDQILQEMWEKWVFLAAFAGSPCLLRAAIGDIVNAPGGREVVLGLIEECRAIAQASGFPPRDPAAAAGPGIDQPGGVALSEGDRRPRRTDGASRRNHAAIICSQPADRRAERLGARRCPPRGLAGRAVRRLPRRDPPRGP